MASLTLRLVKGSPLTNQEVDDNFTNLNNDIQTRILVNDIATNGETAAGVSVTKVVSPAGLASLLKTAALADLTTSNIDLTVGRVLKTGDYGWGSAGGISIASGTDLNTLTVPGIYAQAVTANATLPLNYPVASAGSLLILPTGTSSNTGLIQYYSDYLAPNLYTRSYSASAWSSWTRLTTVNDNASSSDITAGRVGKLVDASQLAASISPIIAKTSIPVWSALVTYSTGQLVYDSTVNKRIYLSLVDNNLNISITSSPAYWRRVDLVFDDTITTLENLWSAQQVVNTATAMAVALG